MVIIVEGLDGVGKTTICKEICQQIPSLIYIKESYTSDNVEKEKRIRMMLERIMAKEQYLYDRTTLIDDFVYNFLNETESSLLKYLDIILTLLSYCTIFHLCLDEETRRKRFENRGDQYISNDMIGQVSDAYSKFYEKLDNVEQFQLSGVLGKDVKKLVRRIKDDKNFTHSI